MRDSIDERAGDLDRGRARTDDPDTPSLEFDIVVPACTVEDIASEVIKAVEGRLLRMMQDSGGRNHDLVVVDVAGSCFQ